MKLVAVATVNALMLTKSFVVLEILYQGDLAVTTEALT